MQDSLYNKNSTVRKPLTASTSEPFVKELTAGQSRLFAYVLTLLPDYQAAQDVLQNINVVLWRKADQYHAGTNFMAWSCAIARLEVLAYYRDRGRDRHLFDEQLFGQLADKAEQVNRNYEERADFLEECIEKQAFEDRQLLRDRYVAGTSVKEIAKEMKMTPNRISVRLCRLRHQLMECVDRKLTSRMHSVGQKKSS